MPYPFIAGRSLVRAAALLLPLFIVLVVDAAAAPLPAAAASVSQGLALPPDASQLRKECNSGRPHVEIRACMLARSRASTQDVEKAEEAMRDAINSRADTQPHLKHSAAQFDAAARAHARFRVQHCEFAAGLAVGQGPQREQRLGCLHDFNLKRLQQLQQIRETLP